MSPRGTSSRPPTERGISPSREHGRGWWGGNDSMNSQHQEQQSQHHSKPQGKFSKRLHHFFDKEKPHTSKDSLLSNHDSDHGHDRYRDSPYGTSIERMRMPRTNTKNGQGKGKDWYPSSEGPPQLPEIISPDTSHFDSSRPATRSDSNVTYDKDDEDHDSVYTARPETRDDGGSLTEKTGRRDRERARSRDRDRLDPGNQSVAGTESWRSPSPSPSTRTGSLWERQSNTGSHPPSRSSKGKRTFMDKIRRYHRMPITTQLRRTPSSSTTLGVEKDNQSMASTRDASPTGRRTRNGSIGSASGKYEDGNGRKDSKLSAASKLRHPRFAFGGHDKDDHDGKGPGLEEGNGHEPVWKLDTDLSNVSDIVQPRGVSPKDKGAGAPASGPPTLEKETSQAPKGSWFAPESWAVKKPTDDPARRAPEPPPDAPQIQTDDEGRPYCLRIFRSDAGFTTISSSLSTTVMQILEILARKSFLQEELENYEIVMWKNDLSRTLDHRERPLLMQKSLLEQAGYQASDRIADIGREDNSYLVRFTFLQTRLGGYSSRNQEPEFNKHQKFNHVDLEGRSLITIPIALYTHSWEIQTLNLSRNLALDVPKDFMQRCFNLRELKYISCEAFRLPLSFAMAPRLTFLDISNNRIDDLNHAQLNRLHTLVSLKMANNKLSSLPNYFAEFPSLRSLNISSNSFNEFPSVLSQVKSLVELDISFNMVTRLPSLGRLSALERLWITNNQLSGSVPEEFKRLTNLKEIDARFNQISCIYSLSALPRLEQLFVGHNAISQFVGSFPKLQLLYLDHCPVTVFDITEPMPTLHTLNLASAKLSQLPEDIFSKVPNLTKLMLNKNRLSSLSPQIGLLQKLEYLSMVENRLSELPSTIGCLSELKYLNLRECNLTNLPPEIWYCCNLETLNLSTNVLVSFPNLTGSGPPPPPQSGANNSPPFHFDDVGNPEDQQQRRPSQASGGTYPMETHSPGGGNRNNSVASMPLPARKPSASSRAATDPMSTTRKDSAYSQRLAMTFAGSLRYLSLADNRLDDEIFQQLALLKELRVLNLSYNELTELPQGLVRRWRSLSELYISGNEFSALPSDDFEESSQLSILHINANKFQSLPAELSRAEKLSVLDVGSNALKYNVSNWRYEWNWNWNHNLKYLNFSGNKRFEIKPHTAYATSVGTVDGMDLTNFSSLSDLRVLGLIDVTLTTPTIPDEAEDRRVRTSASLSEAITYGMADTLGRTDHLSMIDMVVPRFRGNEMETVMALFDGRALPNRGSRISKYLHENFSAMFINELKKVRENEDAQDALRRTFLALNKEMATSAFRAVHDQESQGLIKKEDNDMIDQDDITTGAVGAVLYLQNMDMYVANVGNAEAIVVQSNGSFRHLTQKHDPAETSERERIRNAGGYVSRNGRLNDQLNVSRAFGFFHLLPAIIAAPSTTKVTLTEQDEMVIMATSELWHYVSPEIVADIARAERGDLMLASQKLRDLAMAYGSTNKLMVMVAGVADLRRREKQRRTPGLGSGPSPISTEHIFPSAKRQKRGRNAPTDSRLARYDRVEAPTGELAIIFTDIKGSTSLWEVNSPAMETAIQIHNELFRRQLGIIGGYEAKTEGDAFMVAFSTATAALLWTFSCQIALLQQPWPTEILGSNPGEEEYDSDGNLIYRGLSVRMGIHWGRPVCARDPVTGRMDYFGPMVNRAARICNAADGGQILVSADFITEINRDLETFIGQERSNSTGSDDSYIEDIFRSSIYKELTELSSKGFGVQAWGETKLKGLENPEMLYSVYPYSLSGRLEQQQASPPTASSKEKELHIEEGVMWRLWEIVLRVERICSALESSHKELIPPDHGLMDLAKDELHNFTNERVLLLIDHLITRLENAINTLTIRHMTRPFKSGSGLRDYAIPMNDIWKLVKKELMEYRQLKQQLKVANPIVKRGGAKLSLPYVHSDDNDNEEQDFDLQSSLDPVRIADVTVQGDDDQQD